MNQTVILGALELGGIFAILSLGLYISYKVLNLPDLTVDGSFALGCAVSGMFTINSMPYVGLNRFICDWCSSWGSYWSINYKIQNYAAFIWDFNNDWIIFN